tara:strand:+ start:239 stop:499 length:261 start_codon:yes stop_codon:yes gene_type:complete
MSTGQTLDQVLDMSWDHIQISANAIMRHKSFVLEIIFDAISTGLGGKKKNKKSKKSLKKSTKLTKEQKEQKELLLLHQIKSAGFNI